MHAPAPQTEKPLSLEEIKGIIVGLILAMLLAAIDQTIVATAMPTMGREMGDVENLPWVVTAYLLAGTAVTPLYGKLSDIYGRRVMLQIGIATFVIGSIACGLSRSIVILSVARALQGLGGGGLISLAQTIIADIVAPRERARYQVYIASVFITSSLVGPLLGGFFAEHLHWSLIFWINVPLGIGAWAMTSARLKRLPRHERPHQLDIPGAVLMVFASCTLLLALSWGGLRYPWGSPQVLGLIGLSVLLWAGFGWRVSRAQEPLIPMSVLANPVVRAGTLSACFGMGAFIGLSIYIPIYMEAVYGLDPSHSGLALVPFMIGTVTGATISGRILTFVKHYKRMPTAGLVLSVVSAALVALSPVQLPLWALELAFVGMSMGLGTILPVCTIAIQNAVAMHELGTATGAANFFRSLGGALAVALFGAIVLGGSAVASSSGHGVSLESLLASGADVTGLVRIFRTVFASAALLLACALFFMAIMEERPLRSSAAPAPSHE
ncbi:MDR family MFS transporter [Methylovirgula sp. 4M-Z18]|uniref:MDR family MFS transporter n=1 Tax=Methylovirgula sp. 4M-Z18 TaxID=2293567 RepID=UPI000E2EF8AA|nr:MDR family MFS transporter [Methylovirgula sp. 4M-Z18]RFB79222.1 MFS transporter [Methylovirgula sp. 4M-Z18]